MKILKFFICISAFLLMTTSCEEDYLVRLPLDQISSNDYWKTSNDLKLYVNQFYTSFSDGGAWSGGIYWFDTGTDNMIHNGYSTTLAGTRTVPSDGGWGYGNIRSVNIFLANYESCEDDFDSYKQYLGEAFFFRAFYYANLLRTYGGVPWIDKPLLPDSEELYAPRMPRNELVNKIVEDLDKAIEYMSSGPNLNGTRLNREIAMLFKSRVCLYEGTWEKYHAGTDFGVSGAKPDDFLNKAADAALQVINSGKYSLYSTGQPEWDYWHLFNHPTSYAGNPEIMLWKGYDANLGMTHNHQRYLPRIGGGRGITKPLADDYLCTDGKPISLSSLYQGDDNMVMVSTNRDPRFSQTIFTPGWPREIVGSDTTLVFERSNLYSSDEAKCPTGYQLCKGALPDPDQYSGGWVGVTPSPIFRYAEALLIFAEAKAELGTLTQGDVDISIKLLRDRVGMPNLDLSSIENDPNWQFPNVSPVINEIRRERNVEFACEGFRFDDLMRWRAHHLITGLRPKGAKFEPDLYPELTIGTNVFVDENGYVDPYQNSLPSGYAFDPNRDYLWPVATEQLTLNPNLTQNPGW